MSTSQAPRLFLVDAFGLIFRAFYGRARAAVPSMRTAAGLPTEAIQEAAPAEATPARGGRLAPPAAVTCDRNQLTSYTGKVKSYKRQSGKTVLVIETTADTTETVTLVHENSDDPSRFYLIDGTPFTARDWSRVEVRKGELHPNMSAVAWVCSNGRNVIDWRPGTTFSGAE